MAFCLVQTAISQNITLSFSGTTSSGNYLRLDSVQVRNIDRSWVETAVYPDTVLSFSTLGLADIQSHTSHIVAYPNPLNGATHLSVTVPQSGNATIQVFNLAGEKVAEQTTTLESGKSLFEVRLQKKQVYLLAVATPQGQSVIKLINRSTSAENSIVFHGSGLIFEKRLSPKIFRSGDEIKIVGYTTLCGSVITSVEIQQPQSASEDFALEFNLSAADTSGVLPGLFSVGAHSKVRFSRGNLQWSGTGGGRVPVTHVVANETIAPGIWRFAPYQWDNVGRGNNAIFATTPYWIDLFGWGTSGYHDTADASNVNYQPYSTSYSVVDVSYNYYGYGPSTNMADQDLVGTSSYYDWGVYNAISNGGNRPGLWRTLTQAEWDTLLNYRTTSSGLSYVWGYVNEVRGLILLPDNWSQTTYPMSTVNPGYLYLSNVITESQWYCLEKAGCVFLPAVGYRADLGVEYHTVHGYYWSSTGAGSNYAYLINYNAVAIDTVTKENFERFFGFSVRLVQDAP